MNQAEIFSDVDLPVRKKTFQKTLQKMFKDEEQCVSEFIFILSWRATGNVSEIDRSIAIDGLATTALEYDEVIQRFRTLEVETDENSKELCHIKGASWEMGSA